MRRVLAYFECAFVSVLVLSINIAQAQTQVTNMHDAGRNEANATEFRFSSLLAGVRPSRRGGFSLMPARHNAGAGKAAFTVTPMAASPPVVGSGSLGRLTKWTGFTSSNSAIGNSTIFEDKFGRVGLGTDSPTSRLTVAGMIETLSGGLKFPDGTIQTTAGIAPSQVVRSLNALMGDLALVPGSNITMTPGVNSLTIGATGLLSTVNHDGTLTGNGTSGTPLGVAIPLNLSGTASAALINAFNSNGAGLQAVGGSSSVTGSDGAKAFGGDGNTVTAGRGVFAAGGLSDSGLGGHGVEAEGGTSNSGGGGSGVVARGGASNTDFGGTGVFAFGGDSNGGFGGIGISAGGGSGPMGDGLAGRFLGDVDVSGTLSKGGGSFKIDHPLDPENRYLSHSFVESPDMMNIYNGVAKLDANGEVVVEMSEWFSALNRDFRYLLTPMGAPMPGLYIAEELANNRFRIAGGAPGMKVSWQVTGVRQDAWANKNRIRVEVEKSERERGYYLHHEAFNQPEERSIEWARDPEMMKQRKEAREQAKQKNQ